MHAVAKKKNKKNKNHANCLFSGTEGGSENAQSSNLTKDKKTHVRPSLCECKRATKLTSYGTVPLSALVGRLVGLGRGGLGFDMVSRGLKHMVHKTIYVLPLSHSPSFISLFYSCLLRPSMSNGLFFIFFALYSHPFHLLQSPAQPNSCRCR